MSFEIKLKKTFNIQPTPGVQLGKCSNCGKIKLTYLTKVGEKYVELCRQCISSKEI